VYAILVVDDEAELRKQGVSLFSATADLFSWSWEPSNEAVHPTRTQRAQLFHHFSRRKDYVF
jgi:hypothetical protein